MAYLAIILVMFAMVMLVPSPLGHTVEFCIAVRAVKQVFKRDGKGVAHQ